MFKKILSLLFAFIMILTLFISCSDNTGSDTPQDTTSVLSDNTTPEDTTSSKLELPKIDYENHTFIVLAREDTTSSTTWNVMDICAKEQTGELINDAVYTRNLVIEEKYNITIDQIKIDGAQIATTVSNVVMAGDSTYDAVMNHIEFSCSMMLNGSIMDLSNAPYLDFTQPWWAINIMEDVSIGGRIFFATGDICLNDDKATWGVVFNKKVAEDYNIPNLYDTVYDGAWTIEKLHQYSSTAYADLNGDGKMTLQDDLWGIYDQYECSPALYAAAGMKAVTKDNDNNITYNLDSEKTYTAFDKIYNFMTDQSFQFISENHTITDIWATMRAHYRNNQALFFMTNFGALPLLRDMETDFGLIPLPKIFDDQDEYYTTFQYNNGTAYSIPKSAGDFERSCIILESMAMGSPETLTVAFFDMTLQEKALRDKESVDMMQFILATRQFDFTMAFSTIGMLTFFKDQAKSATNNFASSEAARKDLVLTEINKIFETVSELE